MPREQQERPSEYEKPDDKLRILHWNVEWMFSPASLRASRQVEDEQLKNEKFAKDVSKGTSENQGVTCINQWNRINDVASWLSYFNTNITKEHGDGLDVISLSEIDGCHVFRDLLDLSGLDRKGFGPYHITGNDFHVYQQVGFLSRINPVEPITTTQPPVPKAASNSAGNSTTKKSRKASDSTKSPAWTPTSRASRSPYSPSTLRASPQASPRVCIERSKPSCSISSSTTSVPGDHEIIIMGDFNEYDDQQPSTRDARHQEKENATHPEHEKEEPEEEFMLPGPLAAGNESFLELATSLSDEEESPWATSWVFPIIKYGAHSQRFKTNHQLTNAIGKSAKYGGVETWRKFSYTWSGKRSLLDHILVSQNLWNAITKVQPLNHGAAYKDAHLPFIEPPRYPIKKDEWIGRGENPSDHFPLYIEFDLTKLAKIRNNQAGAKYGLRIGVADRSLRDNIITLHTLDTLPRDLPFKKVF
ncbi:unnamed protein product [Vitrella brassicaformis CCMP3155]|uniref:Endonuclease/exonuclease/phosphatase domain-containing protein n=1 Tax=Vitrella brassicaformis (strain CCMP3155) TaxID=1169540 RepID=A0A0G4EA05_VITBC|nr:unnamed protein product [Vitrella brassicaformis CCMP3155]|eukprot:CEL92046.1 unnamed protein product [Vitrella brassicaformis CCMP3155]